MERLEASDRWTAHRAVDTALGRPVDVVVLHLDDADLTARCRALLTLLAGVAHPHLATVLDVGDDGGSLWYVTVPVDGAAPASDGVPMDDAATVAVVGRLAGVLDVLAARGAPPPPLDVVDVRLVPPAPRSGAGGASPVLVLGPATVRTWARREPGPRRDVAALARLAAVLRTGDPEVAAPGRDLGPVLARLGRHGPVVGAAVRGSCHSAAEFARALAAAPAPDAAAGRRAPQRVVIADVGAGGSIDAAGPAVAPAVAPAADATPAAPASAAGAAAVVDDPPEVVAPPPPGRRRWHGWWWGAAGAAVMGVGLVVSLAAGADGPDTATPTTGAASVSSTMPTAPPTTAPPTTASPTTAPPTTGAPATTALLAPTTVPAAPVPLVPVGYRTITADGRLQAVGRGTDAATMASPTPPSGVVALVGAGTGAWAVTQTGQVTPLGGAPTLPDLPALGVVPNAPVVAAVARPQRDGLWLVARDGGVFALGGAPALPNPIPGLRLAAPVVDAAATPTGAGVWVVAADGGVFALGDAVYAPPPAPPRARVAAVAANPVGPGFWLVDRVGGVVAVGGAPEVPGLGGLTLNQPVVRAEAAPDGTGLWLVAADGGLFAVGTAPPFDALLVTPPARVVDLDVVLG